jgi:hypothetical protein
LSSPRIRHGHARTGGLFLASAVLCVVGVAALIGSSDPGRPTTRTTSAVGTAPPPADARAPAPDATQSGSASTTKQSPPVVEDPVTGPRALPEPVTSAARRFTIAWIETDARPGGDAADDAPKRAAEFAGPGLANQLRTLPDQASRQWQQWSTAQARISAEVLRVTVPDGAPDPTSDAAWARVLFRMTVSPAIGPATTTDEQLALELHRDAAGSWRVTDLPNA